MHLFKVQNELDQLDDFLDQERQAILGGKINELKRTLVEKRRLLTKQFPAMASDRLHNIRRKAERNQALLQAASLGIRAAAEALAKAGAPSEPFTTYDRSGHQSDQFQSAGNITRRA